MPGLIDVIEYSDPTGMEIVHKVPEDGQADIRWGAQLIVRESQSAVFFRDGKALDVFSPGRYTLTTGNLPLLTSFLKLVSAGKTPFQAEVYFVNQKVFPDLKWGTKEPIVFRDAELSMVRLRAFGTYAVRIVDPQLFVNTLAGTQGLYTTETLGSYLKGIIVSRLNDLMGSVMKTILDLGSKYDELGSALKLKVKDDFAEYGVDLKDFFVQAITPPDDVQKMIDERTSMGAVGDMGKFMQYKTAKAIGDMAANPGGASSDAMGMGAGFGVGMMIPGMVKEAMSQPQSSAGTQAAPAAAVNVNCPKCNAGIPQGSRFCLNCGQAIGAVLCPNCKAELPPGAKFCSACGTKIS
ncbi:MAG: SPFH domain-containing protein [Firmicutes bacterium]|nr:SPFH domain-containing protein [Bacillota bacterium]